MQTVAEVLHLAQCHLQAGQVGRARRIYRQLLEHHTTEADASFGLGLLEMRAEQYQDALGWFRRAVAAAPQRAELHEHLGMAEAALGNFDAAIDSYQTALRLEPGDTEALVNLGNLYQARCECQTAMECYDRALAIEPGHPRAHSSRSFPLLLWGQFEEGWREYEWRRRLTDSRAVPFGLPIAEQPDLAGNTALAGRTVLAYCEQGVGDEIMFASCLGDLVAASGKCLIECDPRLVTWYQRSFPQAEVYPHPIEAARQASTLGRQIDVALPVGSLPGLFRGSFESFPRRRQYLACDPAIRDRWQSTLAALPGRLKVGLARSGGATPTDRILRTPPPEAWEKLLAVDGVDWIDLQPPSPNSAARPETSGRRQLYVWPDVDLRNNFEELAGLVAALDLVIGPANTVAHVAGSLGTASWIILPAACHWRWFLDRDDCPWYPTARLFRQAVPGDWSDAMRSVAELVSAQRPGAPWCAS